MPILPDFVLSFIHVDLAMLLDGFSDRLYHEFLQRTAADHLRVQLRAHLDFRPLEQACAAFHHPTGPAGGGSHSYLRQTNLEV